MNKKILLAVIAVLFLSISTILGGYFIGDAIKSNITANTKNAYGDLKVLNLTQVAEYLNMTEKEVKSIIAIEKRQLTNTGTSNWGMLPYITVDDSQYFYKDGVDVWLQEVTSSHMHYDTEKFIMYNY